MIKVIFCFFQPAKKNIITTAAVCSQGTHHPRVLRPAREPRPAHLPPSNPAQLAHRECSCHPTQCASFRGEAPSPYAKAPTPPIPAVACATSPGVSAKGPRMPLPFLSHVCKTTFPYEVSSATDSQRNPKRLYLFWSKHSLVLFSQEEEQSPARRPTEKSLCLQNRAAGRGRGVYGTTHSSQKH